VHSNLRLDTHTGHFNDIFDGPATISSSRFADSATGYGQRKIVTRDTVQGRTLLFEIFTPSIGGGLEFLDKLLNPCVFNEHHSHIVFLKLH